MRRSGRIRRRAALSSDEDLAVGAGFLPPVEHENAMELERSSDEDDQDASEDFRPRRRRLLRVAETNEEEGDALVPPVIQDLAQPEEVPSAASSTLSIPINFDQLASRLEAVTLVDPHTNWVSHANFLPMAAGPPYANSPPKFQVTYPAMPFLNNLEMNELEAPPVSFDIDGMGIICQPGGSYLRVLRCGGGMSGMLPMSRLC
jgi:hypothetical protein